MVLKWKTLTSTQDDFQEEFDMEPDSLFWKVRFDKKLVLALPVATEQLFKKLFRK